MTVRLHNQISGRTLRARSHQRGSKSRPGFTLVELLIVIAIIGLLAGLLLPTLSRSRMRAQTIGCINNTRQLAFAWTLYSADNNDRLVYNLGGAADRQTFAPSNQPNWVDNIMDWTLSPDNTNTSFPSGSLLGPYSSFSGSIYKCPADRVLSDIQRQAGWTARVRSVSMNAMIGDPGSLLNNGVNINNPTYKQFLKETDLPAPSAIFVFLDEHPDSINDGYFLNRWPSPGAYDWEWLDLPASYHNNGGSFSFADGHTEIHRWIYAATSPPPLPEAAALPMDVRSTETDDIKWLLRRMSIPSQ